MVKVHSDSPESPDEYADANHAQVEDGHLLLLTSADPGGKVVAVYAPSTWIRAEVIQPTAS